jgi:hypothetical protein
MVRYAPATLTAEILKWLFELKFLPALGALLVLAATGHAQETLTRGVEYSVDATADGRLVMELRDKLWVVPRGGGRAIEIACDMPPARRAQWSPLADALVFQANTGRQEQIWRYDFASNTASNIGGTAYSNIQPSWHPSAERIVFSSARRGDGFDLWELDLATKLSWRITHTAGDELEPAWSANGRDLVFVHRDQNIWSIMLRRLGEADRTLISSAFKLSAPRWRPDGSLITFQRHNENGPSVDMIILSDPPLLRPLLAREDFSPAPVSWLNRNQLVYVANGVIRKRNFDSWSSSNLPFRAAIGTPVPARQSPATPRVLPLLDVPPGQLILRSARLFDGIGGGYQDNVDIVISDGKIAALEPFRERPGEIVVNLGTTTTLPGYIDSYSDLPENTGPEMGALLLSLGVTTMVAEHADADELNRIWSSKETPGPRVLSAVEVPATDLQLSSSALLAQVSSLADADTPELDNLLHMRQAELLPAPQIERRYSDAMSLRVNPVDIVLGSRGNGLPPGLALHGEFLALSAAGLNGEQMLRAAGVNAARALRLGLQVGRLAPGSMADLVIVDGDPLHRVADLAKVVGVIRNGRFYSAIGLLEQSQVDSGVE